jgi:hypothetical protein
MKRTLKKENVIKNKKGQSKALQRRREKETGKYFAWRRLGKQNS